MEMEDIGLSEIEDEGPRLDEMSSAVSLGKFRR